MSSTPATYEVARPPVTRREILASYAEQFNSEFPNEAAAEAEFLRRGIQEGEISCRACGRVSFKILPGKRQVLCLHCSHRGSFTAGTFFDRIRSARRYLFMIWLHEGGRAVSSAEFARLSGCADSTSQCMKKKFAIVLAEQMEIEETELLAVSSSLFAPIFGKRSKETPARKHPRAEQELLEHEADCQQTNAEMSVFECPEDIDAIPHAVQVNEDDQNPLRSEQKAAFECLTDKPIRFDTLVSKTKLPAGTLSAALVLLQLEGLVIETSTDYYAKTTTGKPASGNTAIQAATRSNSTVLSAIEFVRSCHDFISRKCIQLYLAVHWCLTDRERWGGGSVLRACFRFGPIREDAALSYVSPLIVKLMPR